MSGTVTPIHNRGCPHYIIATVNVKPWPKCAGDRGKKSACCYKRQTLTCALDCVGDLPALAPPPRPDQPYKIDQFILACSSLANATARGTPSSRVFSGDGLASPAADLPSWAADIVACDR